MAHELLDMASAYGLSALAITDHDTVSAYTPAVTQHAKELGIELVPGIEFSTTDTDGNKYHVLGLLIDVENRELLKLTAQLKQRREKTTAAIAALLGMLGWILDADAVRGDSDVVTKAHIARAVLNDQRNAPQLLKAFGRVPTEGEFIEATMSRGKPAFVKSADELSPQEAIRVIHASGGVTLLAHPSFYVMRGEALEPLCAKFVEWGIDGFEAINVQFDKSNGDREVEHIEAFAAAAQTYGLTISGGSDFHHDDETRMGKFIDLGFKNDHRSVPYEVLTRLKSFVKRDIPEAPTMVI